MKLSSAVFMLLLGSASLSTGATVGLTTSAAAAAPAPSLLVAPAPAGTIIVTPAPAAPVSIVITGTAAQIEAVKAALAAPVPMQAIDLTATTTGVPAATATGSPAATAVTATPAATAANATKLGTDSLEGALDGSILGGTAKSNITASSGVRVAGVNSDTSTMASAYDQPLIPLTTTAGSGVKLSLGAMSENAAAGSRAPVALLVALVLGGVVCLL